MIGALLILLAIAARVVFVGYVLLVVWLAVNHGHGRGALLDSGTWFDLVVGVPAVLALLLVGLLLRSNK